MIGEKSIVPSRVNLRKPALSFLPAIKLITIILLYVLGMLLPLNAVVRDDIIFYPGELSNLEKKLLEDSKDNKFDTMPFISAYCIALGLTNEANYNKMMDQYNSKYNKIKKKLSHIKVERDLATKLCMLMHEEILKQYSRRAIFPDQVINKGLFNCVSSSAVYADLLKRYGFKFHFSGVHKHVFINVFLNGKKIQCEPTSFLGFDSGNTVVTNQEGRWQKDRKRNYHNVTILNESEFITCMYYDKSFLDRVKKNSSQYMYILSKKGLYINPDDKLLPQHLVNGTDDYCTELIKQDNLAFAKTVVLDSLKVVRKDKKKRENLQGILSRITEVYLKKINIEEANKFLNSIKSITDITYFNSVVEKAHIRASANMLSESRVKDSVKIIENGLALNKNSSMLKKQMQAAMTLESQSSKDLEGITQKYKEMIEADPQNNILKNNYYATISPLLQGFIIRNQIAEADKYLKIVYSLCGKNFGDKAVSFVYANTLKDYINSGLYAQGVSIGRESYKWGDNNIVYNNYRIVLKKHINNIHLKEGLASAFKVWEQELKARNNDQRMIKDVYFVMKPIIKEELITGDLNSVLPVLKGIEKLAGQKKLNSIVGSAFKGATYNLNKKKEYKRSVHVGEMGIKLGPVSDIKNNYRIALKKYLKQLIDQQDDMGAAKTLIKKIRAFPQVSDLDSLPKTVFKNHLVEILMNGNVKKVDNIISQFKDVLSLKLQNEFNNGVYLSASYDLLQKRQYSQAFFIAERGLNKNPTSGLKNNYISAVRKGVRNYIDKGNKKEASKLLSRAKKRFPDHKTVKELEEYIQKGK